MLEPRSTGAVISNLTNRKIMSQQNEIQELDEALQSIWVSSKLTPSYAERLGLHDDHIHFIFSYEEEEQVDQLIRAVRRTLASFGPEYWFGGGSSVAAQFRDCEQINFKVRKSFIVNDLSWSVMFVLCGPNEGYSLVEDTTPYRGYSVLERQNPPLGGF